MIRAPMLDRAGADHVSSTVGAVMFFQAQGG
jgi:hypothetical protein